MKQLSTIMGCVQRTSRLSLAGLLLLAAVPAAQAQQLAYGSSNAQNVGGTFTDLGTTGTVITTTTTDDANSAAQNIGFTFTYNGTAFTQFVLNTNGLVRLGSAAPSGANMFAQFEAATPVGIDPVVSTNPADVNLLMPFNFDLQAGTSPAEYRVATTGTAPNQVCTIQWKNVSDKASAVAKQYANFTFQLKLYQTTNVIEFVYNTATASTGTASLRYPTVGIKGSSKEAGQTVLAQKVSSLNPWSTTGFIAGTYTATGSTHNFRSNVGPDAGRTYRFSTCSPLVVTTFPYTENFDALAATQSLDPQADPDPTSPYPCGTSGLDANDDFNSWFVSADISYNLASSAPNVLTYYYNLDGDTEADDWFYTPGLALRAGYKYQLEFKYAALDGTLPEALEVKYGTAATPTAQTGLLFSNTNIDNDTGYITTTPSTVTTITPTVSGTYYIGFHAISVADEYALFLDDIKVTETQILAVKNSTNNVFSAEASPVPFGESLTLSLNTTKAGPLHLTMRDALGRVLRQTTASATVGASTVAVPEVASLAPGVYFLTVEQGGATQVLRVSHL